MDAQTRRAFLPSPGRGAAIDDAVRQQLADSLETLYGRLESFVSYDEGRLKALIADVRRGPVRPAIFGTYTDLVESVYADDAERAQGLSDRLLTLDGPCADLQTVTLRDEDLGPDQAERYARLIDDDPDEPIRMQKIADVAAAAKAVADALALIDASDPVFAAEIRDIAREIVVAEPARAQDTGALAIFDGASTFYLWGAVFSRLSGKSRVDLAQTFAHETGHLLLFGLMMGQPLVENAYDERYDSPLREDPRPMEGLVHAAYVIARMHRCLAVLVAGGQLSPDEMQNARADMERYKDQFDRAIELIDQRARFSDTGAEIFGNAVAYMKTQPQAAVA